MKKTLRRLAAVLCMAMPIGCLAQSMLLVETTAGATSVYKLSDEPKATFANGYVTFSTAEASATYPVADLKKFYFADTEDGISTAKAGASLITFEYKNGRHVTVTGAEAGKVRVFDTAGRRVQADAATTESTTSIDLGALPAGTYIIQAAEKQSLKVTKK